jgi:hypothetical protein
MMRSLRWGAARLLVCVLYTGCADPGAEFDAFTKRREDMQGMAQPDSGMPMGGGGCDTPAELPSPEQLSGTYLFVVSTPLDPSKPFVNLLEVRATREGESYRISMREQPLSAMDRKTPVGMFSTDRTFEVSPSGCFSSMPISFDIPAAANPIIALPATTELSFTGSIATAQRDATGAVTFWCGDVDGRTLTPLPMSVAGSTFTATRISDASNLPPVVINCAMTPASPL